MEDKMIRAEEGQLIIGKQVIEKIIEIEEKKKQLDEIQKNYKDTILEIMEAYDIKSYETNDRKLKITRTEGGTTSIFDTTRFCQEHHDLYVDYLKDSTRKSSIRITIRNDK